MTAYAKTAPGERLTYRPLDLNRYAGERFCLRITPEEIDLDRCFFVYLDERFEPESLRNLIHDYFIAPRPDHEAEMASWMEPWLHLDPMLPKKRMLLRQMFARVREHSGKVLFYINHGPGPVDPDDTVYQHLGTSVFDDGSFDDKILDLVLEFHGEDMPLPELDQWARFDRTDTSSTYGEASTSGVDRRSVVGKVVLFLVALLFMPFLLFSCRGGRNGPGGGGFGGGML